MCTKPHIFSLSSSSFCSPSTTCQRDICSVSCGSGFKRIMYYTNNIITYLVGISLWQNSLQYIYYTHFAHRNLYIYVMYELNIQIQALCFMLYIFTYTHECSDIWHMFMYNDNIGYVYVVVFNCRSYIWRRWWRKAVAFWWMITTWTLWIG